MERRIQVRTYGPPRPPAGPTVVVLHGGPGAPGSVAGLARALGARFPVLEPLQRRGGGPRALTVAHHVEDLAAIAPSGAHLVGWSWGAMLALSFAARYPERVGRLALVGCGTYDPLSRRAYEQAMAARLGAAGRERKAALKAELAASPAGAARDRLLAALGELADGAMAVDPIADPGAAPGDQLPADAPSHQETWQDVLRLQAEGLEPAAFAAVRAPVLMLHGEDDPHPGPMIRDTLRATLPQLEYQAFARCGHTPWRERSAREPFLAALVAWLAR